MAHRFEPEMVLTLADSACSNSRQNSLSAPPILLFHQFYKQLTIIYPTESIVIATMPCDGKFTFLRPITSNSVKNWPSSIAGMTDTQKDATEN